MFYSMLLTLLLVSSARCLPQNVDDHYIVTAGDSVLIQMRNCEDDDPLLNNRSTTWFKSENPLNGDT